VVVNIQACYRRVSFWIGDWPELYDHIKLYKMTCQTKNMHVCVSFYIHVQMNINAFVHGTLNFIGKTSLRKLNNNIVK
jgi:hypothetical protein